MPPDRASVLYRELLENIARYLNEMGVPRKYIELMSNTASNDTYWLDDDAIDVPSSTAEWLAVSCGAMTKQEREALVEIGVADSGGRRISARDRMLLDMLNNKSHAITRCEHKKLFNARDAIARVDEAN